MSSATERNRTARVGNRAPIQTFTRVVAVVFLAVGVLGFIPGVTTDLDQLQFASHHSGATLLGLFQVSVLHNLVHLLFGVVGLIASRTALASRLYLVIGGLVHLVLFVYGLLVPGDSAANFVPINGADNVLHLVLAAVMILAGLALSRGHARSGVGRDDRGV